MIDAHGSRVLEFHARVCGYRSDAGRCDDCSRFSRIDIANRNHVFPCCNARTEDEPDSASGAYAWSVLFHLFFVTLLPFSMIVAGRYNLAPAIWVYGANMILLAVTAIGITS